MKKLALLVLCAGALVASLPATARADMVDVTGTVLTCPSENVVFQGSYTFFSKATLTQVGSGGFHSQGVLVSSLRGVTAVGQTSGTQYRVVGVSASNFSFSFGTSGSASINKFVQTWQLVPVGGGPTLSFHEVFVHVFDANTKEAVFVRQGPADCD
jgi:hypothetical protein